MNDEELRIMAKMVANEAHAMATPINIASLLEFGVLRKIGNSYYTDNIHNLPEHVSKKISSVTNTKQGMKLTFYKESKSLKKLAEDLKKWRD